MKKAIKLLGKNITVNLRNDGDEAIMHEVLIQREYRECDEVIKKAQHAILDVGGHLGFFSLYASLINLKVPIYTFEPHEENYQLLKENLKQNRVKNVKSKQVAVGEKQGQIKLQISQEDLNHSTTQAMEPTGETQSVQQTTLERIFQKNRIERCELIKMDCEGAEFEILYHAPDWIFEKTNHLFLEYHDWVENQNSDQLKQFLEKKGYRVQKQPNKRVNKIGFLWASKKYR